MDLSSCAITVVFNWYVHVSGISGLEDHILKSATISSTVACPAFADMYFDASPIVRVALEPKHASEYWSVSHQEDNPHCNF